MMMRNMVTSLLEHEKIETTLAKAKEVRRLADKVILLAKRGDLHARRQALGILTHKGVVKKLFTEIAPRFQDRASGFTHIFRLGNRLGDAAPLSMVMLVEEKAPVTKTKKKGPAKGRSKAGKTTGAKRTKTEKDTKAPKKEEKEVKETESQEKPARKSTPSKRKSTTRARTRKTSQEKAPDSSE